MDTDNWINLIAAIIVGGGTLFLGIMAWRTIRQTRSIQKAEKREGLLNEIKQWAKEAAKAAISRRSRHDTELWDTKLKYKYSVAVSVYITEVVTNSFKDLSPCVNKVIEELKEAIRITEKVIKECEQRLNTYHLCDTRSVVKQEDKLADAVKELLIKLASINY